MMFIKLSSVSSIKVLTILGTFSKITHWGISFFMISTAGMMSLFLSSNLGLIPLRKFLNIVPMPFDDIP